MNVDSSPESLAVSKPPASPRSAVEILSSLNSSQDAGLVGAAAADRLRRDGPNDIARQEIHYVLNFARKFWGLSAWMIELIAVLSFMLHKPSDFAIAIALLVVNAVLSFLQEQRASAAVAALRQRLQVKARVLRDRSWTTVPARELVAGDVVRLRAGDFVPADAQIIDGELQIDQSALTGESAEICATADSSLYSGSVVREGEANAVVTATGARTYYGRTTQLVQSAHPKLHIEAVISRVVRWLFLIVSVQVAIAVALALVRQAKLLEILPLSLVLLMSAVPVALPVMFTVSMALGSIELGRRGVLVTRLSAAEDAANMDILCADKTGTLTMNRLSLSGAVAQPGFTENDVLRDGALASQEANQDAIDLAFIKAAQGRHLTKDSGNIVSFAPFSPKMRKTEAVIERDGRRRRITKGAFRTVAVVCGLDQQTVAALEKRINEEAQKGFRAIAVARADGDAPARLVGIALFSDTLRPDSRELIDELRSLGVGVKMLTGDALAVASQTSLSLGLGPITRAPDLRSAKDTSGLQAGELARESGGFAEVYPEDKFLVVRSLQTAGHVVGMTGDGVNDAPALRQAEVGIAVNGATDVAKGAASVVLTTEGLKGIVELVKQGRAIYQRVLTWIVNKVSRTILKSGFVVVAFLVTGKFVISALGMVLLVFMTDFVKIALSTDRVRPSLRPESWNIAPLVKIAVLLGILMLAESLGLLAFGWEQFDLGHHQGQLQTFTFQTLLFFALVSLISIRERGPFWSSRPSNVLAVALIADACAGVLIGLYGLGDMEGISLAQTGVIFSCALVCGLGINDVVKRIMVAPHRPVHPAQQPLRA